jgi:hypothetical protein
MVDEVVVAAFALAVIVAPVFVLAPLIDRLFENGQLRAIVRRGFRIDTTATMADLPTSPARRVSRPEAD